MAAGREAPARGILEAHAGSFMAVYGCRKTRARSSAQGRDPAGIDRGWVMDIMREPGVRPGLVGRGFEAGRPDRLHVAGIACVRMANGRFGCTAPGRRRARPRVYVIK